MRTKQNMTAKNTLTAMTLGLILSIPSLANAAFTFTTIDAPGSIATFVNANSTHAIAGEYDDENGNTHGFILSNGVYTVIDVPGAAGYSSVNGINASGHITGTYLDDTPSRTSHAYFYNNSVLTTLDPPGSSRSQGGFLNAQSQVVGTYRDSSDKRHGFLWDKGVYATGNVPGGPPVFDTIAFGINDQGQIVGDYVDAGEKRHGFLLSNGTYTTLDVPGATLTVAEGINNAGQIVGLYIDADEREHGFILDNGVYTTIDVPDSTASAIYSINAEGEIVGFYEDANGVAHGYVGTPGR